MRIQFNLLLALLLYCFAASAASSPASSGCASTLLAQQSIFGTVTDATGQPIIGGNVKISVGERFITGAATDFDGNYRIHVDPGTYDLEFSYVGYKPMLVQNVQVLLGSSVQVNNQFPQQSANLEEVVVVDYKVDVMKPDETSQGMTLTSKDVKKLGTRSINSTSSLAAGASSAQEREAVSIRSRQGNQTQYIIDGIRVPFSTPTPTIKYNQPQPNHSGEDYRTFTENTFQLPQNEPLSTFGADVDVAAYANVRRFLNQGQAPPTDAVRTEELVNYFSYDYPQPKGKDPVSITTELGACPWNTSHQLLHIGLRNHIAY